MPCASKSPRLDERLHVLRHASNALSDCVGSSPPASAEPEGQPHVNHWGHLSYVLARCLAFETSSNILELFRVLYGWISFPSFPFTLFCAASCVFHLLSVLQADFMLNYCCWPFLLSLFFDRSPVGKRLFTLTRAESGQIKTSSESGDFQVTPSRSNNDKALGTGPFRDHQALLPPSDAAKITVFPGYHDCETVGFQGYCRYGKRRWTRIIATKGHGSYWDSVCFS